MSKGLKIILIIVAIAVLGAVMIIPKYNLMVKLDEQVHEAWSNVETAYQRRADLIPQLVSTVQGQADYEKSTLTDVIEARAKATKVQIDANNLTPESMAQFSQAQDALSSTLARLLVTIERYPDLKANEAFLNLQAQLEGTENRINKARSDFNSTAKEFNLYIRSFPATVFAKLFGFQQKAYFKAHAGAEQAPKVDFNFNKKATN